MKQMNDSDQEQQSGLFIGSEPLQDVRHRSASTKDDDDGKDGDMGDDDATDTDKTDTDLTDKGDTRDADGKD
jgi:hypothetical protein